MTRVVIGGPYFEDFKVGQVFDDAPSITMTAGHTALYQSLFGDRLRLALDAELSAAVTGEPAPYVHPLLVCNVAIGQSTGATQRVRGNLFYRGLVLLGPIFVGDTIRTRTEVVGLKQNQSRPGKPATGLVALKIVTENQRGEPVLDFWRCPMIPLRDPASETGHADSFADFPSDLEASRLTAAVPPWRLEAFRERTAGEHFADLAPGTTYVVDGRDTVTSAPELARLTVNIAAVHTDPDASAYKRRLVYGGHTISMAGAQASRALPNLVTIIAWRSCDHTAPVFEGDILRSEIDVEAVHPIGRGAGLADLRARVLATRAETPEADEMQVLDWRFVGLMA